MTGPPPPGPPPPMPKQAEAPPLDSFNKKKPQSLDDILAKRREQNTTKPKDPVYIDWKVNSASSGTETVRIVVVSDSHNNHDLLNMPPGDILVHCGDMTDMGANRELMAFNNWLGRQNYAHKIVICGNHDGHGLSAKDVDYIKREYSNAIYLHDSSVTVMGIKFYGSPWVPNMGPKEKNMKYYDNKEFFRGPEVMKENWSKIPEDTDILMTHTPRFGVRDRNFGCEELTERVNALKNLKVHMFGHVHSEYGFSKDETSGLTSINAAVDDEQQPIVFDFVVSK